MGQLVAAQGGAIARWQLLGIGFRSSRVRSWLRTGRLHHTRFPGVYAAGRPDLPELGDLSSGLLFSGHRSALSGLSGLWWRGYLQRRPDLIYVDSPNRTRSRADLRIRHLATVQRTWHRKLPVTPTPSALLLATEQLSHNSLRLVIARAEFARETTLSSIEAACGRGIAGSSKLRAAMDAHLPQLAKCVNGLERDFVLLCEEHRLPIPEPNERVGRFRPDMLWADRMLIAELDGARAHSTPAQLIHDAARQRYLESRGYIVIRFTDEDMALRPAWVAAEVRTALARR